MVYRGRLLAATCLLLSALAHPTSHDDMEKPTLILGKRQTNLTTTNVQTPLTPAEILQQVQIENQIANATQQIIDLQMQLLTIGNASTNQSTSLFGNLTSLPIECNCNCGNNNSTSSGYPANYTPPCVPVGNAVVNPSFELQGGSLIDWLVNPVNSVITDTVNYVIDGLGKHSALVGVGANGTGGQISQLVGNLCPNTTYIFSFMGEPQVPDLLSATGVPGAPLTVPASCDVSYAVGNVSMSTPINNLTSNVGANPLLATGGIFTPLSLNFTTGLNQTAANVSISVACPGGLTSLIGQPNNVTLGFNIDDVQVAAP